MYVDGLETTVQGNSLGLLEDDDDIWTIFISLRIGLTSLSMALKNGIKRVKKK